nr:hypothetical protein [Escherichia coli]
IFVADPVTQRTTCSIPAHSPRQAITHAEHIPPACSNGNAGSSACASARLKVIASKEGYEDGPYKRL